jgi:LysM repeat protein
MFKSARLITSLAVGLVLPLVLVSAVSAQVRHVVAPGDSLSYLSEVYGVTIGEIVDTNGIPDPDIIHPGDELIIPGADPGVGSGGGTAYVVQPGDTLANIAYDFGVSIEDLQAINGIDNPHFIVIGDALTIPGPAPVVASVPRLAFPDRPWDPDIEALLEEFAWAYGVDPGLVKALATVESGWHQWALSSAGAQGVMQIMPGTALYLEQEVFGYELYEDVSAYDNIKMGVKYLALLLESTGGQERLAVASYYQGLTPTQSGVFYPDTADYMDMVMRVRDAYFR